LLSTLRVSGSLRFSTFGASGSRLSEFPPLLFGMALAITGRVRSCRPRSARPPVRSGWPPCRPG
jgi:hypothetical protein